MVDARSKPTYHEKIEYPSPKCIVAGAKTHS